MTSETKQPYSAVAGLSSQEEIVLKQAYAYLFKSWGYDIPFSLKQIHDPKSFVASKKNSSGDAGQEYGPITASQTTQSTYFKARSHWTYLDNHHSDSSSQETTVDEKSQVAKANATAAINGTGANAEIRKEHHFNGHGKINKELVNHQLVHWDPQDIHRTTLESVHNDSLDIFLMRFVVARKFHTEPSIHMLAKSVNWRCNLHPVEEWVRAGDAEFYWSGKHPKLIEAFKIPQAYLRGHDKLGRPIGVVRVKEHLRSNCPDEEFEKFICLFIEWFRLILKWQEGDVNKGSILFDMTGFGMKNADLAAVRFLAVMFEANYPECLGKIWIHNAPWIFNAVWKIIKGWLDPVVASKIRFTKGVKELSEDVDPKYIPKSLGGADTYKYEYVPPTRERDEKKPKDANFDRLTKERDDLWVILLEATIKWLHAKTPEESSYYVKIRDQLQFSLSKNYLELDPYLRTRSSFERLGQLTPSI